MRAYTVCCAVFASLGTFLFGYDSGVITTTIAHASFKEYFDHPSSDVTGAIVSVYIGGEALGSLLTMLFADRLGRKRTIQLFACVATVGTVLQTAAVHIGMLLAGRAITGVAVGSLIFVVPMYNAEISPPEHRGLIVGFSGAMIAMGSCVSNWLGYFSSFAPDSIGDFQWRFPLALQIPPGIALAIGLFWLPYSPRWLLRKGRDAEAYAAYIKLRGANDPEVEAEYTQMREQIHYEMETEVTSFREMWARYKKRLMVSIAVQTCTGLTGVNVIGYYQTTLYTGVGISGRTVLLLAACYGTVAPIANLVAVHNLDRWGRVRMLWIGALLLAADLSYTMATSKYFVGSTNKGGQAAVIVGIFLFNAIYYCAFNSTTWLYGAEVLTASIRAKGSALASFSHFVFNIAVNQAGPKAFVTIGYKFYSIFISCCLVTSVIVFFYFPETKNKTLEEIAGLFGDKVIIPTLEDANARKEAVLHGVLKEDIAEEGQKAKKREEVWIA